MEAALRILSWTWFFRVFHASRAWADRGFRERFLCALYLHGDFTERHLEHSDVNGNHCTADAAGLVFAGLFFGRARTPRAGSSGAGRCCARSCRGRCTRTASTSRPPSAYHRLVAELFLLPALYRRACGLDVPADYRERLVAMARFTAAYSRPDGGTPLWGDADDARALPLGGQALTDHRYLPGLVGVAFDVPELRDASAGSRSEAFWLLGPAAAATLPEAATPPRPPGSTAFPDGGFYVMRNAVDHVFIDCGRVGLAGRGGHGHNDCLSFEAALDGVHLVSDCGAFVYTARSTSGTAFARRRTTTRRASTAQEMNRIDPGLLWTSGTTRGPTCGSSRPGPSSDRFVGAHAGYQRLPAPSRPVRTIVLDHREARARWSRTPSRAPAGTGSRCRCTSRPGSTGNARPAGRRRAARGGRRFTPRVGDRARPGRSRSATAGSRRATASPCPSSGCCSRARGRWTRRCSVRITPA